MKSPKIKIKESELQATILKYLEAQKVFHFRNNTGALKTEAGHFIRFGAIGSPDIICVVDGRFIGLEIKGTGGTQSPQQRDFQRRLEKAGGIYILCYELDNVQEILKPIRAGFALSVLKVIP
jgi:hypothetical protein